MLNHFLESLRFFGFQHYKDFFRITLLNLLVLTFLMRLKVLFIL
jgi:hypothetical protein